MKIGFYLMTGKGFNVLTAVLDAFGPRSIGYVVAARDPQLLRDHYDDIVALCRDHSVPLFNRTDTIRVTCDYAFAISWRWLIPDVPNLIVLHDSLLPRYRGFAPLATALINGERFVGVTALFASDAYDSGDILGQETLAVSYPVKIQRVIDMISDQYAILVLDLCARIADGRPLAAYKQNEADATYSLWRDDEDYRINWEWDASLIKRFVDSLGPPYRGASSQLDRRAVRILDTEVERDVVIEQRHSGKVIFARDGLPVVVCGRGLLRITDARDEAGASILPLKRFRSRFA